MPTVRSLVVYFSRSGNTRVIAEGVAAALHADVEALSDPMERRGTWGYLRCSLDAALRRHVRLNPLAKNPAEYDLVIVGTPVWMGTPSSLVQTFLSDERSRLPPVAFFLTHGGTSEQKVFAEMATLAGKRPLATMAIKERELVRGLHLAKVDRFVETLKDAMAMRMEEEPC